jgi:filamentous hemagglutinin family protein
MALRVFGFAPEITAAASGPITPSGLNTQVAPVTLPSGQTEYTITGGTRPGGAAGTNLFHSFADFNVPTGNIANFLNSGSFDSAGNPLAAGLPTSNILGRVTGGNPSTIFGMIQTTNFGGANLFLMNPYGFLFGPNATLNVGGMVAISTADYLRFQGTDTLFNNASSSQSLSPLSIAPVAAFGFLGSSPAAIVIQGSTLQVAPGQSISLVGGNQGFDYVDPNTGLPGDAVLGGVTLTGGSLLAPGGRINIAGVAGVGEITADSMQHTGGMALGTINFDQGGTVSTIGDSAFGDGSGGPVSIRGGQFVATGVQILTSPAEGSTGRGGDVTLSIAGSATFTDSQIVTSPPSFFGSGSAGAVSLTTNDGLTLSNSMVDASSLFAGGDAGAVALSTNGPLALTNSPILTFASAPGNGGAVTITGQEVTLRSSGITTDVDSGFFDVTVEPAMGQVRPGTVTITAEDTVTLSGSSPADRLISAITFGTLFDAGSVNLAGKTVNLINGTIDASMNDGGIISPANGGLIEIRGNNLNFSGLNLFSNAVNIAESLGTGGTILLRGLDSNLAEFIQLSQSFVSTASGGGGGGGPIRFETKALKISNHTEVGTSSFGIGAGGIITVSGADTLTIESESRVLTDVVIGPLGALQGTAGNILLETQNLSLLTGGQIGARALANSAGNAGSITVYGKAGTGSFADSISIDGSGSGIFSTTEGTGSGGNINLFADAVMIQNGGTLSATTSGAESSATGGVINVKANTVSISTGGTMTAISTGGAAAGEVSVQGLASPAQSILIEGPGSGVFTDTQETGLGGSITLNSNTVTMTNGAAISANSAGAADAGNINITANNGLSMQNSSITTEVTPNGLGSSAGGGNIKITASPAATVLIQNSAISASVADGPGGGGNVSIDPQYVILQNGQILAQAADGTGGNISITAGLFLPDANSVVSADSGSGVNGTVTIQSPVSPASGKMVPLGQRPLVPTSLLSQRCAALAGGSISSFTVAGRDTLPAEPGSWLPAPLAFAAPSAGAGLEARGEGEDGSSLLSLRQIGPTGFLTQTFAVEPSGCQS